MDYKIETRRIIDLHDLSLKQFSDLSGLNYDYVRFLMKPSEHREVNWQKAFVAGYNLGLGIECDCVKKKIDSTSSD